MHVHVTKREPCFGAFVVATKQEDKSALIALNVVTDSRCCCCC